MARPVAGVALVVALVLLAACSGGEDADYDDEFRAEFVKACEDASGRPSAPQVCSCWYDQVSQNVAFDELPSVDDLVGDDFDGAPTRLPGGDRDEPLRLLAACVRQIGQEPLIGTAVPPPTLPRPPTTTTTPVTGTTAVG